MSTELRLLFEEELTKEVEVRSVHGCKKGVSLVRTEFQNATHSYSVAEHEDDEDEQEVQDILRHFSNEHHVRTAYMICVKDMDDTPDPEANVHCVEQTSHVKRTLR